MNEGWSGRWPAAAESSGTWPGLWFPPVTGVRHAHGRQDWSQAPSAWPGSGTGLPFLGVKDEKSLTSCACSWKQNVSLWQCRDSDTRWQAAGRPLSTSTGTRVGISPQYEPRELMEGLLLHVNPVCPTKNCLTRREKNKDHHVWWALKTKVTKPVRKPSALKSDQQPNKWESLQPRTLKQ